jgi:predicted GTPase
LPAALVVDSPGLTGEEKFEPLIDAADDCDMILWVCSAARAAREIDARALAAIRTHFTAEPNRHHPPMLLVLTHIDNLRPFDEWDPPYDLTQPTSIKCRSILGAMQAAGAELGFSADEIVPVRADIAVAPYNVDAVWARIMALMPEAQRARLLRTLGDIKSASAWGTVWSQAVNAGRVVRGTFLSRGSTP